MAEETKIKIGFVNNTLCIYDGISLNETELKMEYYCHTFIKDIYYCLGGDRAKKLGIDRDNIIADFVEYSPYNYKATFVVALDIKLSGKMNINFENIIFKNKVNVRFDINNKKSENKITVTMNKCKFQNDFSLVLRNDDNYVTTIQLRENKFKNFSLQFDKIDSIIFDKSTFSGNFNTALQSTICSNASFKDCIFENNANFSDLKFQGDAYFNNSEFKESANFREAEFEKVANFYGVTFNKVPNFSQAIFKGSLNLVNTNLNFDFDSVKKRIIKECDNRNADKQENDNIPLNKVANDFRDSFRIFKSALIKDNNLLDASNFHKIELYCKEIELEHTDYKKIEEKTNEDVRRNFYFLRYKVDCLLIKFYRGLSDHHTDLLQVFNNLVLLVALYGFFIYIMYYDSFNTLLNAQTNKIAQIFLFTNHKCIALLLPIFIVFILFCLFFININKNKAVMKDIYNYFKNTIRLLFIGIKENIKSFCITVLSIISILFIVCSVISGLNFYINCISLFVSVGFVFSYVFIIMWLSYIIRLFLICFSYIIVVYMIADHTIFLNPVIGQLITKICKKSNSNLVALASDQIFISLTFVYTILMFLVLFSLQKTARKNSIIPA